MKMKWLLVMQLWEKLPTKKKLFATFAIFGYKIQTTKNQEKEKAKKTNGQFGILLISF